MMKIGLNNKALRPTPVTVAQATKTLKNELF